MLIWPIAQSGRCHGKLRAVESNREPQHRGSPQPGGALDLPDDLAGMVAGWLARSRPVTTVLEDDAFLLDPHPAGAFGEVKVRGGRALEVKAYRGGPGF